MSERLLLGTRVAHAYYDDHEFCGKRLYGELVGRERFVGLIARAIDQRLELDEVALSVLDDLAVITTVADPRIWPLKIIRVVSSYGAIYPAWAVANLCLEGARIGPDACGRAGASLVALRSELEALDDTAFAEALDRRFPAMLPPVGFGVPFRDEDERVTAVHASLVAHGRDRLPWWSFFQRVAKVLLARRRFAANIGSAFSSAVLDLGFGAEAIGPLATALVQAAFLANAVEGAAQAPRVLQKLPLEHVAYEGVPARVSPRASAALNRSASASRRR